MVEFVFGLVGVDYVYWDNPPWSRSCSSKINFYYLLPWYLVQTMLCGVSTTLEISIQLQIYYCMLPVAPGIQKNPKCSLNS